MTSETIEGFELILHQYSISSPQVKQISLYMREICRTIIELKRNMRPIDCSCIVDLIHSSDQLEMQDIEKLIQLFVASSPSEIGISRLCELLRDGGTKWLPISVHALVFDVLFSNIRQESPSSIKFPGDVKSTAQLPSLPLPFPNSYSLSMWWKFNPVISTDPDARLFRCRTPSGGIECLVLGFETPSNSLQLRVKSYVEGPSRETGHVNLELTISPNVWYMITITQTHSHLTKAGDLFLYLNDSQIVSHHLPYPFSGCPTESQWILGSGLEAACCGISIYQEPLIPKLLSLLVEGGPRMTSLHNSVSNPQSSVETGSFLLGTVYSKGELSLRACKSKLIYSFLPIHFVNNSMLPSCSTGTVFQEYIEMTAIGPETHDAVRIPMLTGLCEVDWNPSWLQVWLNIGGTTTLLYLLWDYFLVLKNLCSEPPPSLGIYIQTVNNLLRLLSYLLKNSIDARDKFLQEHGFHVIAAALHMIDRNLIFETVADLDVYKTLISSVLPSSAGGDEFAAICQGFLFDFKLWELCKIEIQLEILRWLKLLSSDRIDQLYDSVGVQRLLTVMDLQITSLLNDSTSEPLVILQLADHFSALLKDCLCYSLSKFPQKGDLKSCVALLETSCCSITIERIFQILMFARNEFPSALLNCLQETRYAETAVLRLLCTQELKFSLEVRKDAFVIFFWQLEMTLSDFPVKLLSLKSYFPFLNIDISQLKSDQLSSVAALTGAAAIEYSRREKEVTAVVNALRQIKSILNSVEKIWILLNMFSIEFHRQISDSWGDIPVADVLSLFLMDGALGKVDSIILLPLLEPILSRCKSVSMISQILGSFGGNLRQESCLVVVSLLPDIAWMQHFLSLSVFLSQDQSCSGECNFRSCVPVVLDLFAEVIFYRLKYCGSAVIETLKVFSRIDNSIVFAPLQDTIIREIVPLLFHRIEQLPQPQWNRGMMTGVGCLISIVEEKQLCGNKIVFRQSSRIGTDPFKTNLMQQYRLMVNIVLDFLDKLRSISKSKSLGSREVKVFLPLIRILIGFIHNTNFQTDHEVDMMIADRICVSLIATMSYMSESWSYFSPEAFRDMIISILEEFKIILRKLPVSSNYRDRYSSVLMTIIQHYLHHGLNGNSLHLNLIVRYMSNFRDCVDVDSALYVLDSLGQREESPKLSTIPSTPPPHPVEKASGAIFTIQDDEEDEIDYIENEELLGESSQPSVPSHHQINNTEECNEMSSQSSNDQVQSQTDVGSQIESNENHISKDNSKDIFLEDQSSRDQYYNTWRALRQNALIENQQSEIVRITRSVDTSQHTIHATRNFLKTLRKKIQSEIFLDPIIGDWKLGISHEGSFPGRRRVVIRPKYGTKTLGISYASSTLASNCEISETSSNAKDNVFETQDLGKILFQASPDAIVDVTSSIVTPQLETPSEESQSEILIDEEEQSSPGTDTWEAKEFEQLQQSGDSFSTGPSFPGLKKQNITPELEVETLLICPSGSYSGLLTLTTKELYFISMISDTPGDDASIGKKNRRRRWSLSFVNAVYLRRYRLRDTAVEIFFSRGRHKSVFIDFGSEIEANKLRNMFIKEFIKYIPKTAFKQMPDMSIFKLLQSHGVQQKWMSGEISNFEYLMSLNTLAGRSYNDLCQYPIMPWIISQYSSSTIDLSDVSVYRDLAKPVGALNSKRLESFLERFHSFKDGDIPPFMYGSHYSTMVGVVLHFLIRLQPFASLHMKIQNGHFDVPDRLFSSIPLAWEHNNTLLSEVKELTPEWFVLPDFLKNVNNFDFGEMQNAQTVGDVELPPWASSPEEFIRINREALESDYVSTHLHEWIDLIFGYKQRGPHAIEANNVFYYLTYYGAVNRDMITDEATKRAIELQIAHFGQCPLQLFRTPHPSKKGITCIPRPLRLLFTDRQSKFSPEERLCYEAKCTSVNRSNSLSQSSSSIISSINFPKVLDICIRPHHLVCIVDSGHVEFYSFSLSETAKTVITNAYKVENRSNNHRGQKSEKIKSASNTGFVDSSIILFDDSNYQDDDNPLISLAKELENGPQTLPIKKSLNSTGKRDVLVAVEKDNFQFPDFRIPLPSSHFTNNDPSQKSTLIDFTKNAPNTLRACMMFTYSRLLLSYGLIDGSIRIQDFNIYFNPAKISLSRSSQKIYGGTFFGHQSQVIALAYDELVGSHTDVFASADVSGRILIWTISRLTSPKQRSIRTSLAGGGPDEKRIIISRRPQRVFTTFPSPDLCCDISCQMGVVVSASRGVVTIFSVERNERLCSFPVCRPETATDVGKRNSLWRNNADYLIKSVLLCDEGYILLHLESHILLPNVELINHIKPNDPVVYYYLALYTLLGSEVRINRVPEQICFLSCPNRGNIIACGSISGDVLILSIHSFDTLLHFRPSEFSLSSDTLQNDLFNSSQRGAAIISIRFGPNPKRPAVMTITSCSGGLYVRALPDFAKWDKALNQSTLSQIVQAPIQAVKDTFQQAQHFSLVASDAASTVASNAKSLADGTLAKMNSSKLFKGVGSLFGR